jgi:spore maturation protein CgeB
MRIVMFCHSLVSDWNHGNAHFLRGIATELLERGHQVAVYEPVDGWSLRNLLQAYGEDPIRGFRGAYPGLSSTFYELETLDLDRALDGASLVLVHEWNHHELVRRIGRHRASHSGYRLLFHDTHHRCVTDPASMRAYDLDAYDGVLAFGESITGRYLVRGWTRRAWTWHEAADTRVFRPAFRTAPPDGDLVWIGNWGDEERTAELQEYLFQPARSLAVKLRVFGVRYPQDALRMLLENGIEYGGWLPNYEAPRVFSGFRVTVHIPRRPYATALRGIPTIRVFEALACGIPLVCAPWEDCEGLFEPGRDYLVAQDGREMKAHVRDLLHDPQMAAALATHGLRTIRNRHTCAHRVDQLLDICRQLDGTAPALVGADEAGEHH